MWYKEIVVVLSRAMKYYATAQTVVSAAEHLSNSDKRGKYVSQTALRGLGYIFTKHLDGAKGSNPELAGTPLDEDSLTKFLSLVDEDFSARRSSNTPEDIAEQWMNAYVTQYKHHLAPKWVDPLHRMVTSEDPKVRVTINQMLTQQLHGLKSDSPFIKSFPAPVEERPKHPIYQDIGIVDLLSKIHNDPEFQKFSNGLSTATMNANHYLPFKMYSAFSMDHALAESFMRQGGTSRKGIRVIPLAPFDAVAPGSVYTRKYSQVISKPIVKPKREKDDD